MKQDLKAREERKRNRAWSPAQRWRVLQDTVTWAEAQPAARRNLPAACLAKEHKLLTGLHTRT
jgi:hypothetical protein